MNQDDPPSAFPSASFLHPQLNRIPAVLCLPGTYVVGAAELAIGGRVHGGLLALGRRIAVGAEGDLGVERPEPLDVGVAERVLQQAVPVDVFGRVVGLRVR